MLNWKDLNQRIKTNIMLDEDEGLRSLLSQLSSLTVNSDITRVCDECCLPLAVYGYNPVFDSGEDDTFVIRELCDFCYLNIYGEEQYYMDKTLDSDKDFVIQKAKGAD